MGSSSSGVQRVEPPSYQLPYLERGLQQAQNRYNEGAQVAPFNEAQKNAQHMVNYRAILGDNTIDSAQNYVQNSLNGGFLFQNPYIDATFNKAALASQNQLASEFGRSGRNVEASQGLRAQQLNDLATQIYGGNYANERQLMQGTLGYAQPLGNQAYTDAAQLNQMGQQQQAQQQTEMDSKNIALDRYLSQVRGTDYGSTTTTPGGSKVAGAAGGALSGAALGSLFGPWGALIGGGLGGIGGLFS